MAKINWKGQDVLLQDEKDSKDRELSRACESEILSGFDYTINGISYHFSYDDKAQGNFRDAYTVLSDGTVPSISWTVKDNSTGQYTRIDMTFDLIKELQLPILNHKNGCISKYRDTLYPKVLAATTIDEVKSITWDSV